MRIAGMRLGAPVARLLSEILEDEGYPETAGKIADAIARRVTVNVALTLEDYEGAVLAQTAPHLCTGSAPNSSRSSDGFAASPADNGIRTPRCQTR